MTSCLTISRLALDIFLKHYYKKEIIPIINNKKIYSDIKLAYYGGITEVYKPYGENLYYYDVNSLYPYVALQDMPGLSCTYVEFNLRSANLMDLFGYFYCEIESSLNYLGLLPVRDKGTLIFPNGKWSGWYFSEQLKFAALNGYKINVIKGYNFNREKDVFKSYVESLYKYKSSDNQTIKAISKLLLNSLLGRFGLDINKYVTHLVDKETFMQIATTRLISSEKPITDDISLVTYNPEVDYDMATSFGIDIVKLMNMKTNIPQDREIYYNNVSIVIAAAVTAYGRIHISKIKQDILNIGGNIYYSDTDSIVTNIELPKNMVDSKELGKLKLEHLVKRGYFITSKTYCLVIDDNNHIIKSSGAESTSLTLEDFVLMLKGIPVKTSFKTTSEIDFLEGSVIIKNVSITIDPNSYTKRNKVYNSNGIWFDTTPLIIPELEKKIELSIVKYFKPNLDLILFIKPALALILFVLHDYNYVLINNIKKDFKRVNLKSTQSHSTYYEALSDKDLKLIFDNLNSNINDIKSKLDKLSIYDKYLLDLVIQLKNKAFETDYKISNMYVNKYWFIYNIMRDILILVLFVLAYIAYILSKSFDDYDENIDINNDNIDINNDNHNNITQKDSKIEIYD